MPHQVTRACLHGGRVLLAGLVLLSGCATAPDEQGTFIPPVYPPPPAEPRFVFERALSYNDDVEELSRAQRFKLFATGASRRLYGLVKPFDVAVSKQRVFVSDSVQRSVLLFDIPGRRFREIGTDKPGELTKPLGIDIAGNELFVVDASTKRVMIYDLDGNYKRSAGSKAELRRPSDVVASADGKKLYVVDTGGIDSDAHHVHIYDAQNGTWLGKIGRRGIADGEFNLPLQAALAPDGTLHVMDSGNFRVQSFSEDGKYLSSFGSAGRYPGQFARPRGIATDRDGNIYIVDTAFGNVQIFNAGGQLLMFLGERGHAGYPGKYMLPAGIDIDEEGRIYIVDQFFRKVDVFRPYHLPESATGRKNENTSLND